MRYPARYWLLGGAASVAVHGLIIMAITDSEPEVRIERGAGAAVIVTTLTTTRALAGENPAAALEAVEPEAEPHAPADTGIPPVRPDAAVSREPLEAVTHAPAPARPSGTAEIQVSRPSEAAAVTVGRQVPRTASETASAVPAASPAGDVAPAEARRPPEAPQTDAKTAAVIAAVAADTTRFTEAAPVRSAEEIESRENGAPADSLPAPEEAVAPTPPDQTPLSGKTEAVPTRPAAALSPKQPAERKAADPAKPSAVRDIRPETARTAADEVAGQAAQAEVAAESPIEPQPVRAPKTPIANVRSGRPAAEPVAPSVAPAAEPETARTANTGPVEDVAATRATAEAVDSSRRNRVEPKEAESPVEAVTERRKAVAPVRPREKTVVGKQKKTAKKSRKTARKPKTSKSEKSGRQRVASVRRSGSTVRDRSTGQAGDSGRNRAAAGTASMSNYLGKIVSRLKRQKRYPSSARQKKLQGTAVIAFTVKANGGVAGVRLRRSSGHPALDREVRAMLRRAAPFPPIPKNSRRRALLLSVPITFRMR